MRTLLAHEWLAKTGGSENVFEEMATVLPLADRLVLWNDAPERFGSSVRQTWLANTPLRHSKAAALPWMPLAWRHVSLKEYDRVIVSSHAFAHHLAARAARNGLSAFAYIHTPARYIWTPELDERGNHWAAKAGQGYLRRVDRRSTSAAVQYAANSHFVRARIRATWGQDAQVIYPPVDVQRISDRANWREWLGGRDAEIMDSLQEGFVLGASRMVPYKRLDAVLDVGGALDRPVVLAGDGPDELRLRSLASRSPVPVHFVGRASDDLLIALYQEAALFVFLAIEDFGIMPVEAMAAGTPALVNAIGGARESVESTGLGCVWDTSRHHELKDLAEHALTLKSQDRSRCEEFTTKRFHDEFGVWIASGSKS